MLSACVAPEDFASHYAASPLAAENRAATEAAMVPADGSSPVAFPTEYAASGWRQFSELTKRSVVNYFRSPSYNVTRGAVTVLVAVIFGSTFYTPRRPKAVETFGGALARCGLLSCR